MLLCCFNTVCDPSNQFVCVYILLKPYMPNSIYRDTPGLSGGGGGGGGGGGVVLNYVFEATTHNSHSSTQNLTSMAVHVYVIAKQSFMYVIYQSSAVC